MLNEKGNKVPNGYYGKRFEQDIAKSVPDERVWERLKDTGGWNRGEGSSYTTSNKADAMLFTGKTLFYVELKSIEGHRLPKGKINYEHLETLVNLENTKKNVKCVFIINFRNYKIIGENITKIMACSHLKKMLDEGKKSIAVEDCVEGVECPAFRKIVRYQYDLTQLDNL